MLKHCDMEERKPQPTEVLRADQEITAASGSTNKAAKQKHICCFAHSSVFQPVVVDRGSDRFPIPGLASGK